MNRRCRIAKATNAGSQPGMHFYHPVQLFHESIHDWFRPERFEAVFNFCKCLMALAMTNRYIDDVDMLQGGLKQPCAKVATLIGELGQLDIRGHVFGWDKNRNVRHAGCLARL